MPPETEVTLLPNETRRNHDLAHLEDLALKSAADYFGAELLHWLGIPGKMIRSSPTEIVELETRHMYEDFLFELEDGTKANELRKLDLFEVSVVLVPANRHAEIIDSKARRKYGATISKATGRELYEVLDAIDGIRDEADEAARRIRDLLQDVEEPPADETGDNAGDEGDEEDPETGNSDAKSRAELIERLLKSLSH